MSEVGVAFLGVKNKEGFLRVLVQTRSGHLPKKHPFWKLVLECAKTGWEEGLFGPLFKSAGGKDEQAWTQRLTIGNYGTFLLSVLQLQEVGCSVVRPEGRSPRISSTSLMVKEKGLLR